MAGKKSDLGPIGVNVQRRVRVLREARRLTYAELSRQLADLGRDIPPLGLRRIESGDRKVDVDDLAALAIALNVSPLALLLPIADGPIVSRGDSFPASVIWDWGTGGKPLQFEHSPEAIAFLRDSNPLKDFKLVVIEALGGSAHSQSEGSDGDD